MIKAVFIDGDGVALEKTKFFSAIFAEEHNVPLEKVRAFFNDKFRSCQKGRADMKEEIKPYLKEWGWEKGTDEFLNYWFVHHTKPNVQLIEFLQTLRAKGIKCYLVTDQEKYRAEYISDVLHFDRYFDDCFYSCDLKYDKSQKEYFQAIISKLNLYPKEIFYWDDEDIEMAKEVGINANIYQGFDSFKQEVNFFLKV